MEATLVRSTDPDIIVHSWRPAAESMNPPVYIPKSYVRKASQGLQVRRSGKGLKDVTFYGDHRLGHSGAITVVGDLRHDDMRAIAIYALEFEDMLSRAIGGRPTNVPYRLRFFADEGEFRKVAVRAGASNAMSYYHPGTRDIVMWFNEKMTHDELQALVAHEFTHAYMDLIFGCTSPLWFAEGMAEYFQHFTWRGDRADAGAMSEKELEILKAHGAMQLERFVGLGRDVFYGHEFPKLYAQAWAVVHFLQEYDPDAIQELLHRKLHDDLPDVAGIDGDFRSHLSAMLKRV